MYQYPVLAATPQRPRVYTKEEWEEKRPVFVELYSQDYTLATVRELMAADHGFYATEAQYKKKIKAWGLEKNIDKTTALGILRKERKRKYVEDKETTFIYKGKEISGEKITFLRKRHKGVLDTEGLGPDLDQYWGREQVDTPPFVSYSTPRPVDEPPAVDYETTANSSQDPQIVNKGGVDSERPHMDCISLITHEINKAGLGNEVLDQQANTGRALDCGKTLDNKTQHDYSVKQTFSGQQRQSQRSFNTSSPAPLIPALEEQPIQIHNSSDEGNKIIELDADLGSDESSLSWPSQDVLGDGLGNDNEPLSLHEAAYQGREEIVILLLKQGHSVWERDDKKRTALHWAADGGHEKVVQLLLQSGFDASAKDGSEETALHMAAYHGHEKVVQLLLQSGVDASAEDGSEGTALHMAASNGHEKVVQLLLQSGFDASAKNGSEETALHMAAFNGHEKVVQLLLQSGADVSVTSDWYKETALHMAAYNGHEKVVQLLLQSGVDVSAKDKIGRTALHMAASNGHEKVVQLLLQSGVDVSAKDKIGRTALHLAASKGYEKVVQLLL